MSFDQKAYLADVLKPLTRDKMALADIQLALRELQGSGTVSVVAGLDLMTLLAIPADLSGLSAHIASLEMFLNKPQAMRSAQLLKKLIADLKTDGHDLTSPALWTELQAATAESLATKLADFAAAISFEHQALRIVTTEQLAEQANSNGLLGTAPGAELVEAVTKSGITVCPDFDLPLKPIPRIVTAVGKFSEYRSIVDVLLLAEPETATAISVVDDLRYGPSGTPITMANIEAAYRVAVVSRGTDALCCALKALTFIRSEFANPADMQKLVLASFVAMARELLARGELLSRALVKLTKGTGLDEIDAARILEKVSGSTITRDLTDVANLVAEGALADARRVFDAVANVDRFSEAEVNRVEATLIRAENNEVAVEVSPDVLGIDLGTTYSAVARVTDDGPVEILKNRNGEDSTPSVVYFDSGVAIVGSEAKASLVTDLDNGCELIKRHMGNVFPQEFDGKTFTPESISTLILKELVSAANYESGSVFTKVVIAVPTYFGIREKEATRHAAEMAGLEVVGLLPEPVAAALGVGIPSDKRETVLVYHLGGATFNTTVLAAEPGNVEVLASDGNRVLGGADWDAALSQLVIDKFVAQARISDENPAADPDFMIEIQQEVESKKKLLTRKQEAVVRCRFDGYDEKITVTRGDFVAATAHLVQQTVEITQRVIETARAKYPGLVIDKLILAGGSSRMPMIDEALRTAGFDPPPTDFDLSVAKGAAIYGQSLEASNESADSRTNAVERRADAKSPSNRHEPKLTRSVAVALACGTDADEIARRVNLVAHAGQHLPFEGTLDLATTANHDRVSVKVSLARDNSGFNPVFRGRVLKDVQVSDVLVPRRSAIQMRFGISDRGLAAIVVSEPRSGLEFSLRTMVGGVVES
jgi:molecular chaperone DnaK